MHGPCCRLTHVGWLLSAQDAYRAMVGRLTADELRHLIASVGLSHQQCADAEALRARAWDARAVAREQGGSADAADDASAALMPPVQTGCDLASTPHRSRIDLPDRLPRRARSPLTTSPRPRRRKLELVAPGAAWSSPVPLEAVGTHGLLELAPAARAQGGVRPRGYQLGVSVGWGPGVFGRSKLLTARPAGWSRLLGGGSLL